MRHIYQTTIREAGGGCVVGADGKLLVCIGSYPIQSGDTVWTDGHVIYGHAPIKANGLIISASRAGVPYAVRASVDGRASEPELGYFTDRGRKKKYRFTNSNYVGSAFFVNGKDNFFMLPMAGDMTRSRMLDAEILTDENDVENGCIYAYKKTDNPLTTYGKSDAKYYTVYIEDSFGNTQSVSLKKSIIVKTVEDDLVNVCGGTEATIYNYQRQFLYFRFTDKKGEWELYVGITTDSLLVEINGMNSISSQGVPQYLVTKKFINREMLDRAELVGQPYGVFRETYRTTSEYIGNSTVVASDLSRHGKFFAVVKLKSDGTAEVVHRNYQLDSTSGTVYDGWETTQESGTNVTDTIAFIADDVGDSWTHTTTGIERTAETIRYVKYFLTEGSDDVPAGTSSFGLGNSETTNWTNIIHGRTSHHEYRAPLTITDADVSVDLPDGYKMKLTNNYSTLSILDENGGNIVSNYPLDYTPSMAINNGIVANNKYWVFPHISLYKFPELNSHLLAEFFKAMYMVEDGQLTLSGTFPVNMRCRKMEKIKKEHTDTV